jgi:thioredoxin reductase (NADPH)
MTGPRHSRLIILGSGPAGYSAAVYAARANRAPLLITGVEQGGQLMTTTDVDNWPGDPLGVQGPELMSRMLAHAERFNTQVVNDHIHTAHLTERPLRLEGDNGQYTLEPVYCLGLCASSPAVQIDDKLHARMTGAKLQSAVAKLGSAS